MMSERRMLRSQCEREGFWEHLSEREKAMLLTWSQRERDSGDILLEEERLATFQRGARNIRQREGSWEHTLRESWSTRACYYLPMESLFRSLGVQRENAERFKVLNDTDSKCTNSLSGCDWFKVYTYLIKVHVVFLWIKKTNNSLAFNRFSLDATQGTSVHWSELVTWAQHNWKGVWKM